MFISNRRMNVLVKDVDTQLEKDLEYLKGSFQKQAAE